MDNTTELKIISITKNIHEILGKIYHILTKLDNICNQKDSYITLHKKYLVNYIKYVDNTLLEWHNSLIVIQNIIDNVTFESKMFEKINNYLFYDDRLRKQYKIDIHVGIKQFGQMMFDLNMIFFVHADIAFTH